MRNAVFVFGASLVVLVLGGCRSYQQFVRGLQPKVQTTVSPRFNPADYAKVAVLVVNNSGDYLSEGSRRQVENAFIRAILGKGYTLATRSDIAKVFDELEFQASGATAEDYARVGKMLNVSAIVVASINALYEQEEENVLSQFMEDQPEEIEYSYASIGGRLISVRKAEVLWVANYTASIPGESDGAMLKAIRTASQRVANAFPTRY